MVLPMKGESDKIFTMNTTDYETKLKAIETLCSLAKHLGTSFSQFVEPTLKVALEVLPFQYNAPLRKLAGQLIKYLIRSMEDQN